MCIGFVPYTQYHLLSSISSVWILLIATIYQMTNMETNLKIYNIIIKWKIAFTLPLLLTASIDYFTASDNCNSQCLSINKNCDTTCPLYSTFTFHINELNNVIIFDVLTIVLLLLLRSFILCCIYNKKLKFRLLRDEDKPLLETEDISV